MTGPASLHSLEGLRQDTNDAWNQFLRLFRRDCSSEGTQKSLDLLDARLNLVAEQITTISRSPYVAGDKDWIAKQFTSNDSSSSALDLESITASTRIGLEAVTGDPVTEPCIKSEFVEQSRLPLDEPSVLLKEDSAYLGHGLKDENDDKLGLVKEVQQNPPNISYPTKPPESQTKKRARVGSDSGKQEHKLRDIGKRSRVAPSNGAKAPVPLRGSKTKMMSSKNEILKYWRHFEMEEMAKVSTSKTEKTHYVEHPASSFEQLVGSKAEKGTEIQQRTVTVEDAHAIVSFVTAVASPEALIQFKQALVGWRTQSMTTELMQASGFASVLKSLTHLETQNAFNSIATRIKLVQLADAVDVGHLTLPSPKGRGNPIVKWLSSQYKLFLHAEYPDLKEGSTAWNTKSDDIKRKVKAGRRWQQLIRLFGVGIIGLVPSFALADGHNSDFNRSVKTYSDHCFQIVLEMLNTRKGEHVRLLSAKLEDFMANLFQGRADLPRLVLENMASAQIEAQPNLSPELVTYLDIADHNLHAPKRIRGSPGSPGLLTPTGLLRVSPVDLTVYDENENSQHLDSTKSPLERIGLRKEHLIEFVGTNKMSGAVVNTFMRALQQKADKIQDRSLFLDSDFFPGANRCLSCRAQDIECDMIEQDGLHCTPCRYDGVICTKSSLRIGAENLYDYSRIFIPVFTKEISHWSLVLITPSEKSITHYDSLPFTGPEKPDILTWGPREVIRWVKVVISPARWRSEGWTESTYPVAKQPPHGNDCGVCTVINCRLLFSGKPLPQHGAFTPELMAQMRAAFAKEVAEGKFSDEINLDVS